MRVSVRTAGTLLVALTGIVCHQARVQAQVSSDQPILAERAVYWSSSGITFIEGHNSPGVNAPAAKWAFAEESGGSPKYRVGTYGSGLVCLALTARGLSEFTWLAMSRGFRGTREALQAGNFHLAQRAPATKVCGLDVDINDHNPDRPDFGAFLIAGNPAPAVPVTRRRTAGARLTG